LLKCFLLAVLQALALVVLQEAVVAAVMPFAKVAVSRDSLCDGSAVLERTPDLLGGHVEITKGMT